MAKRKSSPAICGPSMVDQRRWQAESDLSTLRRVEEIRSDPARMREAQKLAKKEVAALNRIAPRGKGKR